MEMRVFRVYVILTLIGLISLPVYSAPSDKSIFKDKKVNYNTISGKQEKELQDRKDALKGKAGPSSGIYQTLYKKEAGFLINQNSIKDISNIYIPDNIGKVIEVYEAPDTKKLIIHIQDLHCNPEAAFNMANILEILVKDYGLSLVCSEGAEGEVDTSSVSDFPDPEVREKVAKLFVDSGELTGEEYLSITKYPKLPIWGIEDKEIYFENIAEFNKIMEFNPDSIIFINKVKDVLNSLKPKIYSKKLIDLDNSCSEYKTSGADSSGYIDYLINLGLPEAAKYKNIALFRETSGMEKEIDRQKIIEQSRELLTKLQSELDIAGNKEEADDLMAKAELFKDKKISLYSFYSHLDKLSKAYIKNDLSAYPDLFRYISYLNKVNSLDSVGLFQEIDDLTYEAENILSDNSKQKNLIKAIRNINTLDSLFNISISNEQYDYYLKNKDTCNVNFFKTVIIDLSGLAPDIDYNPALIDNHLEQLENFYTIAYKRDTAMSANALKKIEETNARISAIITGGFHTRGITKTLKNSGCSYIVISPYSKTTLDEENYRFLLSGKRRPIEDLIKEMNK